MATQKGDRKKTGRVQRNGKWADYVGLRMKWRQKVARVSSTRGTEASQTSRWDIVTRWTQQEIVDWE